MDRVEEERLYEKVDDERKHLKKIKFEDMDKRDVRGDLKYYIDVNNSIKIHDADKGNQNHNSENSDAEDLVENKDLDISKKHMLKCDDNSKDELPLSSKNLPQKSAISSINQQNQIKSNTKPMLKQLSVVTPSVNEQLQSKKSYKPTVNKETKNTKSIFESPSSPEPKSKRKTLASTNNDFFMPDVKLAESHVWSVGRQSDSAMSSPMNKKHIKASPINKTPKPTIRTSIDRNSLKKDIKPRQSTSKTKQISVVDSPKLKNQELKPFYAGSRQSSVSKSKDSRPPLQDSKNNLNDEKADIKRKKLKNKVMTLSKAYMAPAKTDTRLSTSKSTSRRSIGNISQRSKPDNLKVIVIKTEASCDDDSRRVKKITNTVRYVKMGSDDRSVSSSKKSYTPKLVTNPKKIQAKLTAYSKPISKKKPEISNPKLELHTSRTQTATQTARLSSRRDKASITISSLAQSHHKSRPSVSRRTSTTSIATVRPMADNTAANMHAAANVSISNQKADDRLIEAPTTHNIQKTLPTAFRHDTGMHRFNKLVASLNSKLIDDLKNELQDK